jgi:hypothetical protein
LENAVVTVMYVFVTVASRASHEGHDAASP